MAQNEFDISLAELEIRLERLRSLYEQYFLGIERIEPGVARKDVDRRIWAIRKIRVNNTAKRFRLQGVIQRYNTLQQYWGRICRQIETGTYRRHVARAERRFGSADGPERSSQAPPSSSPKPRESQIPPQMRENLLKQTELDLGQLLAAEIDGDAAVREAVDAAFSALSDGRAAPEDAPRGPRKRPPVPARTAAGSPRPDAAARAAAPSKGVDSAKIDALYEQLVAAKRNLNPASKVNKDTLARSLRQTEAKLLAKHEGRSVDFRVEIRDGKAQIKPIVR